MKVHNGWLPCFISFFLTNHLLFGEEKIIQIINGSQNDRPQKIERLNLIRLQDGMQIIKSFERIGPMLTLKIPEDKNRFPYMLQGIYQGVKYNRVIPPVSATNNSIELKVYEKTNRFQNIQLRILYVVRYVDENLHFLVLYRFANESKHTFVENKNGLHFFIPNQAKQVNASVSVGSGLSNIQWLKMNPEAVKKEKNIFLVAYPLKPGERIYQIGYKFPYDGSSLSFPIRLIYPVSEKVEVLLETKDLNLRIEGKPNWSPQKQVKKEMSALSGDLIALPSFSGTLKVIFQRGEMSKADFSQEMNTESILILSPLNNIEKIMYPVMGFIFLLTLFIYLQKKPVWLVQLWLRKKSLLEYQLDSIHRSKELQYVDLTDKLKKKLFLLEKKLKEIN